MLASSLLNAVCDETADPCPGCIPAPPPPTPTLRSWCLFPTWRLKRCWRSSRVQPISRNQTSSQAEQSRSCQAADVKPTCCSSSASRRRGNTAAFPGRRRVGGRNRDGKKSGPAHSQTWIRPRLPPAGAARRCTLPPPHTPEPELSPGGSGWREGGSVPLWLLF